jgi:hypothetical protein
MAWGGVRHYLLGERVGLVLSSRHREKLHQGKYPYIKT